jgi:hypothetical protein
MCRAALEGGAAVVAVRVVAFGDGLAEADFGGAVDLCDQ